MKKTNLTRKQRLVAQLVFASSLFLLVPAEASAQNWSWWNWGWTSRTTYRPFWGRYRTVHRPALFPSYGISTCNSCTTHTVGYVPQTCYRTVAVNVPVTTLRPVAACDPCTGCVRTVMRPMTSYVTQTRRVPYTSYRRVYYPTSCCPTSPCITGCSSCSSCTTGCSTCALTGSTCSQCTSGRGVTTTSSSTLNPIPSTSTPKPTYAPPENSGSRTFQKPIDSAPEADSDSQTSVVPSDSAPLYRTAPSPAKSSTRGLFRAPRLINPQDKLTQIPNSTNRVTTASHIAPASVSSREQQDATGWRASR